MANHGETISTIKSKIISCQEEGQNSFNLLSGNESTKFGEQQLLLNYLIHMAVLGHNCKKYEISKIWENNIKQWTKIHDQKKVKKNNNEKKELKEKEEKKNI